MRRWMMGLLACGPVLAAPVQADDADADRDTLLRIVDTFFVAMHENDPETLKTLVSDQVKLRGIRSTLPEGDERRTLTLTFDQWANRGDDGPTLVEVYWDPVLQIRPGLMATVWTPYEIEADGKRLHCGINLFTFQKHQTGWRITDLQFTIEPDACEDLRPASRDAVRPKALQAVYDGTQ